MGSPWMRVVQKLIDANKATQGTGLGFENLGKSIQEFARNPMQAAKSAVTGMLEKLGPLRRRVWSCGDCGRGCGRGPVQVHFRRFG